MRIRTVDTTKKSNIKCEHCRYWPKGFMRNGLCRCSKKEKYTYYYQRCKDFDWTDEIKEQTNVDQNTK